MDITDYEPYEVIKVELRSASPRKRSELHCFLLENGIELYDYFYIADLPFDHPATKDVSLMYIDVFLGEEELDDYHEEIKGNTARDWDVLKTKYKMYYYPRDFIKFFCEIIEVISSAMDLSVHVNGKLSSVEEFSSLANRMADELDANLTPAGSEQLIYLVELRYS